MTILSERLHIRPVTLADTDDVWRIFGDPATHQFNPNGPLPTRESAELLIEKWLREWRDNGFGQFAITLKNQPDEVIGYGGIIRIRQQTSSSCQVEFRFIRSVWGNGYASEFTNRMLWFGFTALKLGKIHATVPQEDLASRRVLEKNGLRCARAINDLPGAEPSLFYELTLQQWRNGPETVNAGETGSVSVAPSLSSALK